MSPWLPKGPGDYTEAVLRSPAHPDEDNAARVAFLAAGGHPDRDYTGEHVDADDVPADLRAAILAAGPPEQR